MAIDVLEEVSDLYLTISLYNKEGYISSLYQDTIAAYYRRALTDPSFGEQDDYKLFQKFKEEVMPLIARVEEKKADQRQQRSFIPFDDEDETKENAFNKRIVTAGAASANIIEEKNPPFIDVKIVEAKDNYIFITLIQFLLQKTREGSIQWYYSENQKSYCCALSPEVKIKIQGQMDAFPLFLIYYNFTVTIWRGYFAEKTLLLNLYSEVKKVVKNYNMASSLIEEKLQWIMTNYSEVPLITEPIKINDETDIIGRIQF